MKMVRDEMKTKRISVEYDISGRTFNYNGYLVEQNKDFLVIDDDKEGILHLNIKNIIKIKEMR